MENEEQQPIQNEDRAKEYSRIKIRLTIINLVLTLSVLAVLVLTPLNVFFRDSAHAMTENSFGIVFLYFLFFFIFNYVVGLPMDFYSSFILEHTYGLSNQTFWGWLWEGTKKTVLSFLLGLFVVEILYAIIRQSPEWWWVWCWACFILFSIVLNKLFPVFIVPLFYKYEAIKDESLRTKILLLFSKTALRVENIYSLNLSKTTKKANAAFMGIGKTKRVVLGDTLLENFTSDEIEAVVAHEIGHYVYRHLLKNIVFSTITNLIAFYIAWLTLVNVLAGIGIDSAADVASFPIICLVFFVFGILTMPAQNAFSRLMEREADAYALNTTRKKADFISTMDKLSKINLSDPEPNPVIEFIFFSHPSVKRRIAWATNYAMQ